MTRLIVAALLGCLAVSLAGCVFDPSIVGKAHHAVNAVVACALLFSVWRIR